MIAFNLRQQVGRNNILANPRIRAKSREKARIHIGDKVPVITTTAGATGFVSESVNYLDVGLKLEVEPQVYLDDDVGIKVGLEVSNIAQQIKTTSGTIAYQVGTRNAATTLRLKDGETQVLAGLINDEDRRSAVAGAGRSPAAGDRAPVPNNDDTVNKTEIVLLITPRVIRNIERPGVAPGGVQLRHRGRGRRGARCSRPRRSRQRREPSPAPVHPRRRPRPYRRRRSPRSAATLRLAGAGSRPRTAEQIGSRRASRSSSW